MRITASGVPVALPLPVALDSLTCSSSAGKLTWFVLVTAYL
jgi:hypothetical protein